MLKRRGGKARQTNMRIKKRAGECESLALNIQAGTINATSLELPARGWAD
jgi:hypothetical protein